jgi:hypothetical protein
MQIELKEKRRSETLSSKPFSLARRIGVTDSCMVADVGFKKQLWALDPELDVVWNFVESLWEIWRFPGQAKVVKKKWNTNCHHVMTIKTQKGFRELGADILLKLQVSDSQKYSVKQIVDYFDQQDKNLQRARQKDLINRIHDKNVDTAKYVLNLSQAVPKEYMFETSATTRIKRVLSGGL